jgi:hypothetical protein
LKQLSIFIWQREAKQQRILQGSFTLSKQLFLHTEIQRFWCLWEFLVSHNRWSQSKTSL